jgi:hypothetical protein
MRVKRAFFAAPAGPFIGLNAAQQRMLPFPSKNDNMMSYCSPLEGGIPFTFGNENGILSPLFFIVKHLIRCVF